MTDYTARIADAALAERLEEAPAVLIVGPRASGKTMVGHHDRVARVRRRGETDAPLTNW